MDSFFQCCKNIRFCLDSRRIRLDSLMFCFVKHTFSVCHCSPNQRFLSHPPWIRLDLFPLCIVQYTSPLFACVYNAMFCLDPSCIRWLFVSTPHISLPAVIPTTDSSCNLPWSRWSEGTDTAIFPALLFRYALYRRTPGLGNTHLRFLSPCESFNENPKVRKGHSGN